MAKRSGNKKTSDGPSTTKKAAASKDNAEKGVKPKDPGNPKPTATRALGAEGVKAKARKPGASRKALSGPGLSPSKLEAVVFEALNLLPGEPATAQELGKLLNTLYFPDRAVLAALDSLHEKREIQTTGDGEYAVNVVGSAGGVASSEGRDAEPPALESQDLEHPLAEPECRDVELSETVNGGEVAEADFDEANAWSGSSGGVLSLRDAILVALCQDKAHRQVSEAEVVRRVNEDATGLGFRSFVILEALYDMAGTPGGSVVRDPRTGLYSGKCP